jgi:diadenosine tetraphosphate (Ap4A) HIT family hydrolase
MSEGTPAGFTLATALRADCHVLGRLTLCQVLLVNKAEVPWFIAVPETTVIELCDLSAFEQTQLQGEIDQLARWLRAQFAVTKLNIAAIGNIVPQLHIHIIGRHPDDVWWPGVVWGQTSTRPYPPARVAEIATLLEQDLGSAYQRL